MKKLLTFFSLIIMLVVAVSVFAQQNNPLPPQNLRAFVESGNNDYTSKVKLVWERNPYGVAPQMFIVYLEYYASNGTVGNKVLANIRVDSSNRVEYYYVIENLPAGVYVFYVTAAIHRDNRLVESEPSNRVKVELSGHSEPRIIIYSQPPVVATVGFTYHYQVLAKSISKSMPPDCVVDSYELLTAPDGMTISDKGLVEWTPTAIGEYPVKIKVSSSNCPDLEPAIQEYLIRVVHKDTSHNQAYVRFVSQPPTIGVVGKQWVYKILVESNIRCPVGFKLIHNYPDGVEFKVEESTMYWTPRQPGEYSFVLVAFLTCDTTVMAYQKFTVTVKQHDDHPACAVISGTATFEDGSSVPNGIAVAWRLNDQNVPGKLNAAFKTYIHDGQFEFYLPEGTYILEFDGEHFYHEFYEDANTIAEATRIEVKCGDDSAKRHINVTVVLKKKPEPIYYNVSGKVVSAKDNVPVMAMVEFIPVELLYNSDSREKYPVNYNFMTKTDQNGDYTIKLPNIFTYKAHAIPIDKVNYMDQYYDQVNSPYEADIIELTGDVDNINFYLESPLHYQNGFAGIVIDENQNPIKSRVFAYLVNPTPNSNMQHYVRMTETNEQGQFMFQNLIPGEYVLFSVPIERTYVPGYYKQNDFATLKWREATHIAVDDIMLQVIFEIKHRVRTGLRGLIRVDGRVVEENGLVKVGNEPQGESLPGLPDAYVYVLDDDGNLSDYFITDFDGRFSLTEVPEGTSTIYVSRPGYTEAQVQLTADYQKNYSFNYEIPVSKMILKVDDGINNLPFSVIQSGDVIRIELNSNNGIINFAQIYDAMGRVLKESKGNDNNSISLTISGFTSGVYFIRVNSSFGIHTVKLVVLW